MDLALVEYPIINVNGTLAVELLKQWLRARRDLIVAETTLRQTVVHGRDYPRGHVSHSAALREQNNRLRSVTEARREVEGIVTALVEQIGQERPAYVPIPLWDEAQHAVVYPGDIFDPGPQPLGDVTRDNPHA